MLELRLQRRCTRHARAAAATTAVMVAATAAIVATAATTVMWIVRKRCVARTG